MAAAQPSVDEWNPSPIRPGAPLGRWVDGTRSLELRADGTYTLRNGAGSGAGRYRLSDWNLTLAGAAAAVPWRVVKAGGEYRIVRDPEEPDAWDGDLGVRHTPPAESQGQAPARPRPIGAGCPPRTAAAAP